MNVCAAPAWTQCAGAGASSEPGAVSSAGAGGACSSASCSSSSCLACSYSKQTSNVIGHKQGNHACPGLVWLEAAFVHEHEHLLDHPAGGTGMLDIPARQQYSGASYMRIRDKQQQVQPAAALSKAFAAKSGPCDY